MLIFEPLLAIFLGILLFVGLSFWLLNLTRGFFNQNIFLKSAFRIILVLFVLVLSIFNLPTIYQIVAISTMKPETIRTYFVEVEECYVFHDDRKSDLTKDCLQKKKKQFPLLKKYIY